MPSQLISSSPDMTGATHAGSASAVLGTELLKLRTVRAPLMLVTVGVLMTAFFALQPVFDSGREGAPSIGTAASMLTMLSAAGRGQLLALVIGVLTVTGERRHQTLTATLLQSPHRIRLLYAKAVAAALAGLLLGLLSLAVAGGVAMTSGALRGSLVNDDVVVVAAGQLLAYPLYGLLGVGIGSLIMASQPVAVLLPVAWFLVLESYVEALAHSLSAWLPGPLTAALANAGEVPHLLPVWAGGLGLLGYGLFLFGAGAGRLARRDVG
jgi:ABC-2 type transport system permease protein